MASKKIKCPLLGTEIEDGICFDIHMNVEDWHLIGQFRKRCEKSLVIRKSV